MRQRQLQKQGFFWLLLCWLAVDLSGVHCTVLVPLNGNLMEQTHFFFCFLPMISLLPHTSH